MRCADVKAEVVHPPHWHVVRAENITFAQGQCTGYRRPETCPSCGHVHTPTGCKGGATPSDLWAGVTPAACDCDATPRR